VHPLQIEGQSAPFPFAGYGIKSAPRELAETHDVFNDPKHGFDRAFTATVQFASCLRLKPPGHFDQRIFRFGRLQHRGHLLMGSGHSIAVQNFNENLSILLMLGAYSLMIKAGFSI
jgi:hypothetical protein